MTAIYTTPFGVTSQFYFCGLPLRLDTYRGCAFQCGFCFARYRGGKSPDQTVVPAHPKTIERIVRTALNSSKQDVGIIGQFLRNRTPVHLGGMSDPFQPIELRDGVTAAALRVLSEFEYPTVISTRGILPAAPQYLDLLRSMKHIVVQFSLSSSRDDVAIRVEPRSSSPTTLLKAMEKLASAGIPVTIRWQPFVPGVSESPEEFVSRVSGTGCSHVGFEHLKVPIERYVPQWRRFTQLVGKDLFSEYKEAGAVQDGREFVLPMREKLRTVLRVRASAHRAGITFGAADNEFQYLSDTHCCCSGADKFRGFENYFKHQIGYAIRKSKGSKSITYDRIEQEWTPTGSIDRFLNSDCRIARRENGDGSIRHHIRHRWNRPDMASSPATFFGIKPTHRTTNEMLVYEWDGIGE